MLCNIKPVQFHESDKHIFAKIPGGVRNPGPHLWIRPWSAPCFNLDQSKMLSSGNALRVTHVLNPVFQAWL